VGTEAGDKQTFVYNYNNYTRWWEVIKVGVCSILACWVVVKNNDCREVLLVNLLMEKGKKGSGEW